MERGSETDEETRRLSPGPGSGDGGNGGGGRRREGEGRGVPILRGPRWPTIDGQLGLSEEESVVYARKYFRWGFFLLPFFWALNCFYFWPVLRHPSSFPRLRPYVVRSAIGFVISAMVLSTWSLVFMIGGKQLFGPVWNRLRKCFASAFMWVLTLVEYQGKQEKNGRFFFLPIAIVEQDFND